MKADGPEFGRYAETMRTIARLYDVIVVPVLFKRRSEAAKRGWETRRKNQTPPESLDQSAEAPAGG